MDSESDLVKGVLFQVEKYGDRQYRSQINPEDMDGQPLSIHWEKGDTFLSVTFKKFKAFFENIFDPRNYS